MCYRHTTPACAWLIYHHFVRDCLVGDLKLAGGFAGLFAVVGARWLCTSYTRNPARLIMDTTNILRSVFEFIPTGEAVCRCQLVCRTWHDVHRQLLQERWIGALMFNERVIRVKPKNRVLIYGEGSILDRSVVETETNVCKIRVLRQPVALGYRDRCIEEVRQLRNVGRELFPAESIPVVSDVDTAHNLKSWTFDPNVLMQMHPNAQGDRFVFPEGNRSLTEGGSGRCAGYRSTQYPSERKGLLDVPGELFTGLDELLASPCAYNDIYGDALLLSRWTLASARNDPGWSGFVCMSNDVCWMHNNGSPISICYEKTFLEFPIRIFRDGK